MFTRFSVVSCHVIARFSIVYYFTTCVDRIDGSDNFDFCVMLCTVLPSVGIAALSAREAEGRTNISAGEKVGYVIYLSTLVMFPHSPLVFSVFSLLF